MKIIPIESLALLPVVDCFMPEARDHKLHRKWRAALWLANNEREFNGDKMEKAFKERDAVRLTEFHLSNAKTSNAIQPATHK